MKKIVPIFVCTVLAVWQTANAAPVIDARLPGGYYLNTEYTVGTGSNLSLVVIDFNNTGGGAYAFGYRWNDSTDFASAITAIANQGPVGSSLDADLAPADPIYGTFVNNFTYKSDSGNSDDYWRLELGTYASSGITWSEADYGISSLKTANFTTTPTVSADMNSETVGIIGFYNSFEDESDPRTPVTMLKSGDFNFDGHLDASDIKTIVTALADINAYRSGSNSQGATLMPTDTQALDLDGDHQITNADLQYLLNVLIAGGGSTSVPEPDAWLLAVGAASNWLLIFGRRAHWQRRKAVSVV